MPWSSLLSPGVWGQKCRCGAAVPARVASTVSEGMQCKHKAVPLQKRQIHFRRGKYLPRGGNSQATQSQIGDIMTVGSKRGDLWAAQTEEDSRTQCCWETWNTPTPVKWKRDCCNSVQVLPSLHRKEFRRVEISWLTEQPKSSVWGLFPNTTETEKKNYLWEKRHRFLL